MKHTEATMWRALAKHVVAPDLFTRIEVTTGLGISDVEYVAGKWHGWAEFKADSSVRETSKMQFGSPFTAQQYSWLLSHHNPAWFLRSWVVIGRRLGKEWLMVPAPATGRLLVKDCTVAETKALKGARVYETAKEVYMALRYY